MRADKDYDDSKPIKRLWDQIKADHRIIDIRNCWQDADAEEARATVQGGRGCTDGTRCAPSARTLMTEAQAVADELNVTPVVVPRVAIERGLRPAAAFLRRKAAPLLPAPEPSPTVEPSPPETTQ